MKENKFKINCKQFSKDDIDISWPKLNNKIIFERRNKKSKTLINQNVDKLINKLKNKFSKEVKIEGIQKIQKTCKGS